MKDTSSLKEIYSSNLWHVLNTVGMLNRKKRNSKDLRADVMYTAMK